MTFKCIQVLIIISIKLAHKYSHIFGCVHVCLCVCVWYVFVCRCGWVCVKLYRHVNYKCWTVRLVKGFFFTLKRKSEKKKWQSTFEAGIHEIYNAPSTNSLCYSLKFSTASEKWNVYKSPVHSMLECSAPSYSFAYLMPEYGSLFSFYSDVRHPIPLYVLVSCFRESGTSWYNFRVFTFIFFIINCHVVCYIFWCLVALHMQSNPSILIK